MSAFLRQSLRGAVLGLVFLAIGGGALVIWLGSIWNNTSDYEQYLAAARWVEPHTKTKLDNTPVPLPSEYASLAMDGAARIKRLDADHLAVFFLQWRGKARNSEGVWVSTRPLVSTDYSAPLTSPPVVLLEVHEPSINYTITYGYQVTKTEHPLISKVYLDMD